MVGAKCEQGLYLERASARPCFYRGASTPTAGLSSTMLRGGRWRGRLRMLHAIVVCMARSFVGQMLRPLLCRRGESAGVVRVTMLAHRPSACDATPCCPFRSVWGGPGLARRACLCFLVSGEGMPSAPTARLLHPSFVHRQTLGHTLARRQLARRLCMIPIVARVQVSCCVHVRT